MSPDSRQRLSRVINSPFPRSAILTVIRSKFPSSFSNRSSGCDCESVDIADVEGLMSLSGHPSAEGPEGCDCVAAVVDPFVVAAFRPGALRESMDGPDGALFAAGFVFSPNDASRVDKRSAAWSVESGRLAVEAVLSTKLPGAEASSPSMRLIWKASLSMAGLDPREEGLGSG